jgi:hypothetical protein
MQRASWHEMRQRATETRAEDMGLEPAIDFNTNVDAACNCDKCDQCGAVNALQTNSAVGLCMASIDADLQLVIAEWEEAPQAIRRAILALLNG